MMRWMHKYTKAFSLGLQSSMEYRVNFLLGFLSIIFPLTIQFFMWNAIYKNSPNKIVYGYTLTQMITYSVLAAITAKLVATGFEWEMLNDIKNGGLSKFIIKPIGYFQYRLSCFIGDKSFNFILSLIIIIVFLFIYRIYSGFEVGIFNALIYLLSIIMALLINFLIYFSLASFAFWMSEASSVFVIMNVVVNIVSGGIFPLDIFGEKILRVFDLLPFKYTIYFPVNILNGRLGIQAVQNGLIIQAIWIAIMLVISNVLWGIGLKKYTAVGG